MLLFGALNSVLRCFFFSFWVNVSYSECVYVYVDFFQILVLIRSLLIASQFDKHAFCYLCAMRFTKSTNDQTLKMMHAILLLPHTGNQCSKIDLHNNWPKWKTKAVRDSHLLKNPFAHMILGRPRQRIKNKNSPTTFKRTNKKEKIKRHDVFVGFCVYWFAKNGMELKIIYGWFFFPLYLTALNYQTTDSHSSHTNTKFVDRLFFILFFSPSLWLWFWLLLWLWLCLWLTIMENSSLQLYIAILLFIS